MKKQRLSLAHAQGIIHNFVHLHGFRGTGAPPRTALRAEAAPFVPTAAATAMPGGYRSGGCVVQEGGQLLYLCTGPTGCDASVDGGDNWFPISGEGYHAIAAGSNASGWAVGSDGRIARWSLR